MDTDRDTTIEMAGAGDRQVVEVHDEGGPRQHHKTRDRRSGKEEWRGGNIVKEA